MTARAGRGGARRGGGAGDGDDGHGRGDGDGGGDGQRQGSLAASMCSASSGGNWRGKYEISQVFSYIARALVPVRATTWD